MDRDVQTSSIHVQIVVEAPIELAFTVFTEGIGTWFPPEYNLLAVSIARRIFEPRVGGRVYDRGTDGSECQWARVLAYEPPNRVVISWDISPRWQIETDRAKTSEVEVRFIAVAPDRTRVGSSIGTSNDMARDGNESATHWVAKAVGLVVSGGSRSGFRLALE